jgi:pimeloyl-ACP methyl ester carboxylesterase
MRSRAPILCLLFAACAGSTAPPTPPTPPAPPAYQPKSFSVQVSGAGRPVIFIPGLTCDGRVWDGTVAHFGGKIQAHVVSLAGFTGHAPIDAPLVPTARDEVIEYIRQNHLDHPIVVGHSLGGFLTIWIAETAPDLLGGAVAVDGGTYLSALFDPDTTPEKAQAGADQMAAGFASLTPEAFKARVQGFIGTMLSKPDEDGPRLGPVGESDIRTTAEAMKLMMTTDLRPGLAKITVPFVEIAAGTVRGVPPEVLRATWHKQIDGAPKAQLVIIENSKHFVMFDQPDAFYAALDKNIFAK